MNKEETLEGNKLIAEFMEGKPVLIHLQLCKYDKSWDWLMPVVEKIESLSVLYSVEIIRKTCVVRVDSNTIFSMYYKEDRNKIESTWSSVIKFIKWYNLNKQ